MKKLNKTLEKKLLHFHDEYFSHCSKERELFRENNAEFANSGRIFILFAELEKKHIGQYFDGFQNSAGSYTNGITKIYANYLKQLQYRVNDRYIKNLEEDLKNHWEKILSNMVTYLKGHFMTPPSDSIYTKVIEYELKPVTIFETKRFINNLSDLRVENRVGFLKRVWIISQKVGSIAGLIAILLKLLSIKFPELK